MKDFKYYLPIFLILYFFGCTVNNDDVANDKSLSNSKGQPVYLDVPYEQDFSVKYYLSEGQKELVLKDISPDRNGNIRILSNKGLLMPDNGSLFYPGKLVQDVSYTPLILKKISAITTYLDHTVYLDNRHIFSNAWAGKIQIEHGLVHAKIFAGGKDFHFLVSDGEQLVYVDQDGNKLWEGRQKGVRQILYQESKNSFLFITPQGITEYIPGNSLNEIYQGANITCAEVANGGEDIVVGTTNGYMFLSEKTLISKEPWPEITTIKKIRGEMWFGTTWGAFRLNKDDSYSYYAGERWLPGDEVLALEQGPKNSVVILTNKGLGQIHSKEMTLEEKALFYEKQVREKNIRYGFNCSISRLPNGYASATMGAQASDNLWTAMYLTSQLLRYKVTGDEEAKINAQESFEAMERLHTITNIDGLFARSFERDYLVMNTKEKGWERKELKSGSPAKIWMPGSDHANWTWRSTASSDQAVGQMFALTMILELSDDTEMKARALKYMDDMMGYIVDNDLYIIDVDGEPTLWGKWNPDYVNGFPENVGDRRLYSSNIIAFLQTAYKFTGKEKYKEKAYELIDQYGYLENLMRPIREISPSDADEWSKTLSVEWNHSDDEMYFLAYPGLVPYAFTPELGEKYIESIKDHWEIERPEKNALWNFIYAMNGAQEFDLEASIGFLQQYPLDLRNWRMHNSHRKDIVLLPDNFRKQTTEKLLPLGEIPLYRHNGNIFSLDRGGDGTALISAGDTWLLPYWLGRYLDVISAPVK